jgi:hypothetical protein
MSYILEDVILPKITIDNFMPKSGQTSEIVVLAFYATDRQPAEDLNYFLQRSALDIIDVEVSPNPDEDGNFLIFVELERNHSVVEVLSLLIKEIEHVTGKLDWMVKPYLAKKWYSFEDPSFLRYFSPSNKIYEDVTKFLSKSNLSKIKISGHAIVLENGISAIISEFGDSSHVKAVKNLNEAKINVLDKPRESTILEGYLGENYGVISLDGRVIIYDNEETVLVLENVTFYYG